MATNVILSPNIVRTAERLDASGNVIDPRTKQIIVPREVESVVPIVSPEVSTPSIEMNKLTNPTNSGALSILDQIAEAKKNLENLEELKRLSIEEKKKELELLQQ